MTDRKPLVIANWKMELSYKAEIALARSLKSRLKGLGEVEVVVCPSFSSLESVRTQLGRSVIALGAQNVHWEEQGPWTGAVSVHHLRDLVTWCLVGHSEQRKLTGQDDNEVVQAAMLLLAHGVKPVVCIGESFEEQQAEASVEKVTQQVQALLAKATRASLTKLVIAYEPLWAIGSGVSPDPNDVAATMLLIRKLVAERFDEQAADRLRILYGGSVTPANVESFLSEPGVDGVLVGGASVHIMQLEEIVMKVRDCYTK